MPGSTEAIFVGIDLSWIGNKRTSGGAVLRGNQKGSQLLDVTGQLASDDVEAYVQRNSAETTFVAIDAPLIITNSSGQRCCETMIGKYCGGRHASCHSSNRSLYPQSPSVLLASRLISQGFEHAPLADYEKQRVMLEVYPHQHS